MRKKVIKPLILLIIISLVLLSACHPTEPGETHTDSGTVLTLGVFDGSIWPPSPITDSMVLEELLDKFKELYPDIKIEVKSIKRDEYAQYINNAFMSGEEPDIFYIEPSYFPVYAGKGLLLDLDERINKDSEFHMDDMYKKGMDEGKYDGKQYALPRELSPTLMFANKSMLAKDGLEIDSNNWNWDSMKQIVEQANKDTDNDGKLDQYGIGYFWWIEAIYSNGADIIDSKGKPNFGDPRVKEALQYVVDMYKLTDTSHTYQEIYDNLMNGKYALFPFKYSYYNSLNKSPYMNFDWDVVQMPKGKSAQNTTGIMESLIIGISSRSKNTDNAWKLLKFMTNSKEGQRIVYNGTDGLPAMKTILDEPDIKEDLESYGVRLEVINQVVENAANTYKHPKRADILKIIDEEVLKAVKGEKTVDQVCEELNNKVALLLME